MKLKILIGLIVFASLSCEQRKNSNSNSSSLSISDEIKNVIWDEVWYGFSDNNEITLIIQDNFLVNTPGQTELLAEVKRQRKIKKKAKENWKPKSDWERLSSSFRQLNSEGIISLHFAGYTKDDCVAEVVYIFDSFFASDSLTIKGYCTYSEQDLEDLIPKLNSTEQVKGSLLLTFGDILGGDKEGVLIGERIIAVLSENGLKTRWDNNINHRIEITDLRWEKTNTSNSWMTEYNNSVSELKKSGSQQTL